MFTYWHWCLILKKVLGNSLDFQWISTRTEDNTQKNVFHFGTKCSVKPIFKNPLFFSLASQPTEADRSPLSSSQPPVLFIFPSTSRSTSPLFRLNSLSALGHGYDSSVCHIEDARQTDSQRVHPYLPTSELQFVARGLVQISGNLCCLHPSSLSSWPFVWLLTVYFILHLRLTVCSHFESNLNCEALYTFLISFY